MKKNTVSLNITLQIRSIRKKNKIVLIGGSAGGIKALEKMLGIISPFFNLPIIIVLHRLKHSESLLVEVLQFMTELKVEEAAGGKKPERGIIYVAPSDKHLEIGEDGIFSLNRKKEINYSRPSIDVTFCSAAKSLGDNAIGVILSGANKDGSFGLKEIHLAGGTAIVQNPEEAQFDTMPLAGSTEVPQAYVKNLVEIATLLNSFSKEDEPY